MKILHIIPYYDFFPPKNGGALRCYHINQQLAKYFEVTLLTYQNKKKLTKTSVYDWDKTIDIINPTKDINIHGLRNKIINALKYRIYKRTFYGPAELSFLMFYKVLIKLLNHNKFDAVVFEHLMSHELSSVIRRINPKIIQIIDMHNVDYLVYKQENNIEDAKHQKKYNKIKQSESNLYKTVNEILCCSELDKTIFEKINNNKINVTVIPNGTAINNLANPVDKKLQSQSILFCGALNYYPNIEGLIWFLDKVWAQVTKSLPEVKLKIIGRGTSEEIASKTSHPRIELIGEVGSVNPYYAETRLAIVPLHSGSGTRLKVLEAMGFGVPIVSTSKGAEGINYTKNKNILIADNPENFYEKIVQLFQDNKKWLEIAKNGKELIEKKYTWEVVGEKLKETIINATG